MFLCLKRLRDFFLDDFKRYLDAVNDTLESGKPSEGIKTIDYRLDVIKEIFI